MGLLEKISRHMNERSKLTQFGHAYLRNKGWQKSLSVGGSVARDATPIPWITYPATMMLQRIAAPDHKVLEYGCGNSSLWWSRRVQSIVAVEHDKAWAEKVSAAAPENLAIVVKERSAAAPISELVEQFFVDNSSLPTSGRHNDLEHGFDCKSFVAYASQIESFGRNHFDIVIIDGMARSLCAWLAAHYVKSDGLIAFDNSERWQYNPGFKALCDAGFKRIDFYGPGPLSTHETCTSIFSKTLCWAERSPLIDEKSGTLS